MALWKAIVAFGVLAAAALVEATEKPLVSSESLREALSTDALREKAYHLQSLAYKYPTNNRLIGSQGHNDTITWLHDTIAQFPDYYTVELQPYPMTLHKSANLTINDKTYQVFGVGMSPSGTATGRLVAAANNGCEATDFPAGNLNGTIVLVYRGICSAGIKVGLAASRGAVGVIVYSTRNAGAALEGFSLQLLSTPEGPYVPTGVINLGDGQNLLTQLQLGVNLTAHLTTEMKDAVTYNVIAQTLDGDQDNVIHISGHSDSVVAGPGINDNGSGTISILEIAIQLTNFTVNNAVRFSWWTAEEEGLLGAAWYVSKQPQSELDKIRLMLDFDMMASPNYAIGIYDGDGSAYNLSGPPGSAEAEHDFIDYFVNIAGLNYTELEFDGRSDYGPFLEAGVATGGIAAGAEGLKTPEEVEMFGGVAGIQYDVNYHEDGDNVNNLNYESWIQMSRAIAHMTAKYALSFDSLPPKNVSSLAKREAVKQKHTKKSKQWEKAIGKTFWV